MARERFFKGSNSSGAREVFNSRSKFAGKAYSAAADEGYPGLLRDFWFIENLYYGRIDRDHRPIIAPRDRLKSLVPSQNNSPVALDFVCDAFADMKKEFDKHTNLRRISDEDPYLSDLSAKKSWVDLNVLYNQHVLPFRKDFLNNYILARSLENKIKNFEDFVDSLMSYLEENLIGIPFTRTGFLTSKYCTPLVSGLHVEIADISYDKDSEKIAEIIDSPNFNFFELCATKYGFLIDKNLPFRLVANIGSVEMENYMKKYDTDSDLVFEDYYGLAHAEDIDVFIKYCIKFYNRFVNARPNLKEVTGEGRNKVTTFKERPRVKFEDYAPTTLEKQKYWLDRYIKIRNIECQNRYTKAFMSNLSRNFGGFLAKGDYPGALRYIGRCFIGFLNDTGGYNAYVYAKAELEEGVEISRRELDNVLLNSIPLSRETQY